MSITDDIRAYADTAVNQGKQVLGTAQAQLSEYTDAVSTGANDLVGRTRDNVADLSDRTARAVADARQSAEKAVNLDAVNAAVEPYVAQLREYTAAVTDKFDDLVATARSDKRVAAVLDRVEPVVGVVAGLANERVVKPVQSLTGLGGKPAHVVPPVRKPTPKPTSSAATPPRKRAAVKPAGKPVTKPVNKPAARKTAAKSTTS